MQKHSTSANSDTFSLVVQSSSIMPTSLILDYDPNQETVGMLQNSKSKLPMPIVGNFKSTLKNFIMPTNNNNNHTNNHHPGIQKYDFTKKKRLNFFP